MKEKTITVSELINIINDHFDKIGDFWVIGEVSNLKVSTLGHTYFTLKDETSQIECALFLGRKNNLDIEPENSKKFLIYGHLDYYGKGGKTQIIVEKVKPVGVGELAKILQERKEKLAKLGLFSPEHKKNLPRFPEKIGIVTSVTGAVIKDMIRTLQDRFPPVRIIVRPSLVQGDKAAEDIANGIKELNEYEDIDVIIIGRGGGSGALQLEDLWAFNEEIVAWAIYNSKIPIISAIGHAENITIADLVADVTAITPTDAANKVVPSRYDILNQFSNYKRIMKVSLERKKRNLSERVKILSELRVFKYPLSIIEGRYIELDRLYEKMYYSVISKLKLNYQKVNNIKLFTPRIRDKKNYLNNIVKNINREISRIITIRAEYLNSFQNRLISLSPEKILKKGYSIVFKDNKVIKSAKELFREDKIKLRLADGEKEAEVI